MGQSSCGRLKADQTTTQTANYTSVSSLRMGVTRAGAAPASALLMARGSDVPATCLLSLQGSPFTPSQHDLCKQFPECLCEHFPESASHNQQKRRAKKNTETCRANQLYWTRLFGGCLSLLRQMSNSSKHSNRHTPHDALHQPSPLGADVLLGQVIERIGRLPEETQIKHRLVWMLYNP